MRATIIALLFDSNSGYVLSVHVRMAPFNDAQVL